MTVLEIIAAANASLRLAIELNAVAQALLSQGREATDEEIALAEQARTLTEGKWAELLEQARQARQAHGG